MDSNYNILLDKLESFIRKYYKNLIIRGSIFSGILLLTAFLSVVLLEYFGHFGTITRTTIFYSFLILVIISLGHYVIRPALKLWKIGERLSYEQAASIVGNHFRNVSDKLLNILQLNKQVKQVESDLLLASIDQKAMELKPVPFTAAINFNENKRLLSFLLPIVLILGILMGLYPSLFSESTQRLIQHQKKFEPQAPFEFVIKNNSLEAVQQEDFTLDLSVQGNSIPDEVYIEVEESRYRLKKLKNGQFQYIFKNVQRATSFRFYSSGFFSKQYELNLISKPSLLKFEVFLDYPKYTGKKQESLRNKGDLIVPQGTKIKWVFETQNTKSLWLELPDTVVYTQAVNANSFEFITTAYRSFAYEVGMGNEKINKQKEEIAYNVSVIEDAFPTISVIEKIDSLSKRVRFFFGSVNDDYGITQLTFNYRLVSEKGGDSLATISLPISKTFYHTFDINTLKLKAGEQLDYYFEVWDNDGVNGRKSTRSKIWTYSSPTLSELEKKQEEFSASIKSEMEESIQEAKNIQEEVNKLKRKMTEKKSLDWDEKNKLKELLEQQKKLEERLEKIKTQNAQNNTEQNEYKNTDERILEKQERIQELFEQVMNEEMKEMFKELEKLLEDADKQKIQEMMDEMELSNEDIEKELDRTLELFKQLEFEQKMEETINKLDELAKKQEELAKKTKNGEQSKDELEKEQEKLNKEFEEVKKDLEDLEKKNEALEFPNDMEKTDQEQQDIEESMEQSSDELQQGKNKKASQSQQSAAEQMKSLSQKMKEMQEKMEQEANQEDIDALRQLLENLIQLSFDQEELMGEIKGLTKKDPKYFDIGKRQKKIQLDAQMIEDSLFALSKRNPEIESTVNREINEINQNIEQALHFIQERMTQQASAKQQYVMTATNNLALLLDEIVQQMQQQQSQQKFGEGSCSKPSGGPSPKPGNMKQIQQQINKQIEQLKQQGSMPQPGGKGKGSMSKELAKLAAEQEALRNQIQKLSEEMGKEGNKSGKGNLDRLSELMEETEKDLVNKQITNQTLKRQEEIMSRLLEHEKAEREREFDDKRESKEAVEFDRTNITDFPEYERLKQQELELLKTVSPEMNIFYKRKVTEYFQEVK